MGCGTITATVLVLWPLIKWQAIPKGLTDPSRDCLDHLLRSSLRTWKALSIGDLWYWLCYKLCVRSERGSGFGEDFGLSLSELPINRPSL